VTVFPEAALKATPRDCKDARQRASVATGCAGSPRLQLAFIFMAFNLFTSNRWPPTEGIHTP
jgi:hypothetical protein